MENEIREAIFKELGVDKKSITRLPLFNSRTSFIKKYSHLNKLIDIVNVVCEEKDDQKLNQMLLDLKKLDKEHKLDDIRNIDLYKEVKEEYLTEYNVTTTQYGKLIDDNLSKLEGIEFFNYKGKKFVVLNGVPFRFLGRTIDGNGVKNLTSPYFTKKTFGSLISNIRFNRWKSSEEFDIFDELQSDNYCTFGASDAYADVNAKEQMISPEILQRCIRFDKGPNLHTTVGLEGKRSASSSLITMEKAIDFEKSEKWIPYDTVYVLNEECYRKQSQKRVAYFNILMQRKTLEQFSKTANPEIFYDLISSSINYFDNGTMKCTIKKEKEEILSNWIQDIHLDQCDNLENLRHIVAVLQNLRDLKSVHSSLFLTLGQKCESRIQEIVEMRNFSMIDEIESCLEELHEMKENNSEKMMIDFITNEINQMKEKGLFIVGESVKDEILGQDKKKDEERNANANKIKQYANGIRLRQKSIDTTYEELNLKNNQENIDEIVYKILEIAEKVRNKNMLSFDTSCEVTKKIVESEEFSEYLQSLMQDQKFRFDEAIRNKVQELISSERIKEFDEQIKTISNLKFGILAKLIGKDRYYEAIKKNLSIQKLRVTKEQIISGLPLETLGRFIEENGMTSEIYDFLQKYHDNSFEITEGDKLHCEKFLHISIKEKTKVPIEKLPIKDYRRKTKEIIKDTETMVEKNSKLDTNVFQFLYEYKPNYSVICRLRSYIDHVNQLADGEKSPEKDKEK